MQPPSPKTFSEITSRAFEENSRSAQRAGGENSPGAQSLVRRKPHLSFRSKINMGYALALGIAVSGTIAGLAVGNYEYQQAQQQAIDVDEEARLIRKLNQNLAHTKVYALQILSLNEDAENLQKDWQKLANYQRKAQLIFAKLPSQDAPTKLEPIKLFQETYSGTIEAYLQKLETLVQQIKPPVDVTAAQELVLEFSREDVARAIPETLETMEKLQQLGNQIEDGAREDLAKAEALRIKITLLSVALSIAIATLIAIRTSREIARPLQILTAFAHQVTEDANFDLRAPVNSADEVGVLATSLNQLIQQVKYLLEEQKAAGERQLVQNEKLATLGKMLAGVAHELNNPLGCIYGNLDHAQKYFTELLALIETYRAEIPEPPPAVRERAEEMDLEFVKEDLLAVLHAMKLSAERSKEIVRSLKNFSRLDEAAPHPVDLRGCLDSTLLILQNRLKGGISVVRNYGEVPAVEGYAGMLSQVFMNVLSNAIDALQSKASGGAKEIRIATECLNESWVAVRISDSGTGMTPEIQEKIFEFFFTTKPRGAGTGLGLAISYQIVVEKHGGRLVCASEVGKGTEFSIELPVQHPARAASPISSSALNRISG